jgi:hypothetical protein
MRSGMRVHRGQQPPGRGLLLQGGWQPRGRANMRHADVRLDFLRGLVRCSGRGELRPSRRGGRERGGRRPVLRRRRRHLPGLAGHVPGPELRAGLRVRERRKRSGGVPLHGGEQPRGRVHRAYVRDDLLRARMHLREPHLRDLQLPVNEVTAGSRAQGSNCLGFLVAIFARIGPGQIYSDLDGRNPSDFGGRLHEGSHTRAAGQTASR